MPLPDIGREVWLSPGRALEIPFTHDPVQVLVRARIVHGDLTALLYLQGYRDEEIVRN